MQYFRSLGARIKVAHLRRRLRAPSRRLCLSLQKTPPPLCTDSSMMLLVDKNAGIFICCQRCFSVRAHKNLIYECSKFRGHLPWKCSERRPSSPFQPRFFIAMSLCRPMWRWSTRCHKHQFQNFCVPTKKVPQKISKGNLRALPSLLH